MTAEELPDAPGFSFDVPEGAKNVIYRCRKSDDLAEMQYILDSDEFCTRRQPMEEPKIISGMFFGWENEEEAHIGYIRRIGCMTGPMSLCLSGPAFGPANELIRNGEPVLFYAFWAVWLLFPGFRRITGLAGRLRHFSPISTTEFEPELTVIVAVCGVYSVSTV